MIYIIAHAKCGNQRKHTQLSFLFIFLPPIFDFVVNLGHQNNQPILAPPPYIDTIKSSDNSRVCIENNYTFVDSSGRQLDPSFVQT